MGDSGGALAQPHPQGGGGSGSGGGGAGPPATQTNPTQPQTTLGAGGVGAATSGNSGGGDQNSAKEPQQQESGDESEEEESEILEESPCGRWLKRREEVNYRDVPGIDQAFLAMDTEEGVEVVWNEAMFSETKKFKAQEDKLKNVFEALTLIEHPNIVKFHRYWTDDGKADKDGKGTSKPRVILITEFMSSGSLKQFLRKTKRNSKKIPLQSWKRWCTQILSALSYLHSCTPAIIHGNLTCDTIFIQHNGLVKIGSVAPDAIHKNVKTFTENIKNFHYLAPEWAEDTITLTPAIDIFAFGMCALETAALELTTNGETGGQVSQEAIEKGIDSLEDEMQKDFIRKCLVEDPSLRPKARELLFHPVLFEVHSLKLLAAHTLVKNPASINESLTEEAIHRYYGNDTVMASMKREVPGGPESDVEEGLSKEEKLYRLTDFPVHEKLEKFMEDVKYGIYPLTAFALATPPPTKTRAPSPELYHQSDKSNSPEPQDVENRRVLTMQCSLQPRQVTNQGHSNTQAVELSLRILLRMEDNMNRQLSCLIARETDTPVKLAVELVQHGFIHHLDSGAIQEMLEAAILKFEKEGPLSVPTTLSAVPVQ